MGSSGRTVARMSSRCSVTDQEVVLAGDTGRGAARFLHLLGYVTAKPGPEVRAQVLTFAREPDNGTSVVAAVAGVIAAALEDDAVHRGRRPSRPARAAGGRR